MEVDVNDIEIFAQKKRTVWVSGYDTLEQVLNSGYDIDSYFDEYQDWEEDDYDDEDFQYQINVSGVISQSQHNNAVERLTEKIDKLQKQVEELLKKDLNLKKHDKVEEE